MDYDLLIKNGRVVDGSGLQSYVTDVGIKDGKIAEIGRLHGTAYGVQEIAELPSYELTSRQLSDSLYE